MSDEELEANAGHYRKAEYYLKKAVDNLGWGIANDDLTCEYPRALHHILRALIERFCVWGAERKQTAESIAREGENG